jgi:mannose-6-phosphate isomerase-like protein (cupin superfamily)
MRPGQNRAVCFKTILRGCYARRPPIVPHWHEPKAGENAGLGKFKRPAHAYDSFIESEGIPCYRGIGVRRVQDLPLADWKRLGGRGSYIQLFRHRRLVGLLCRRSAGAGALNTDKHLYEKVVFVVEGRGTTEVWRDGDAKRHVFEWQKGSLFSIPLNTHHRFINAGSQPALLYCGTTAPNMMNLLDNRDFIFNCPYEFTERFSGAEDYFKPKGRSGARSSAWACHAAHQSRSRHHQHGASAG